MIASQGSTKLKGDRAVRPKLYSDFHCEFKEELVSLARAFLCYDTGQHHVATLTLGASADPRGHAKKSFTIMLFNSLVGGRSARRNAALLWPSHPTPVHIPRRLYTGSILYPSVLCTAY